ncbi:MAG TPA: hypothetical protein VGP63_21740 [Planctomycetaceae bacterium]|jgi:hypothetical protein|nr:hypothetical protein [Planctomycetaceae bacterium]
MKLSSFRDELRVRDERLETYFDRTGALIQSGAYSDTDALWTDKDLGNCQKGGDLRSAFVIFPQKVHLLPTSVFYDRLYVTLHPYTPETYTRINDDVSFRCAYQMTPSDLLVLIRANRVVPVLDIAMSEYSDYVLQNVLMPLLTQDLPYLTFAGWALICQTWQAKYRAFPDPKKEGWGFLIDLCGAMGIGANLVRPEFESDIWQRRELIFDTLGFDEVAASFISNDLSLDEFFVSAGISYNSRIPIADYLSLFDKVDKNKIYEVYSKLNKDDLFGELRSLNKNVKEALRAVDREQTFLKVMSAPVGLLFYLGTLTLGGVIGEKVVAGLKSMTDDALKKVLRLCRSAVQDALSENWEKYIGWFNGATFPDILELARAQRLIEHAEKGAKDG